MNTTEIIDRLMTIHVWDSRGQDTPELTPCPFCGGEPIIVVHNPMYGWCGAAVKCSCCDARGPRASIYGQILTDEVFSTPLLPESLERGIAAAVDAWNSKRVDRRRMGNMVLEIGAVYGEVQ